MNAAPAILKAGAPALATVPQVGGQDRCPPRP